MKPRRTHDSNHVFQLEGGTEDNDLWSVINREENTIISVWELSKKERIAIAGGANIALTVWGAQPPVALEVTSVPLGKAPA